MGKSTLVCVTTVPTIQVEFALDCLLDLTILVTAFVTTASLLILFLFYLYWWGNFLDFVHSSRRLLRLIYSLLDEIVITMRILARITLLTAIILKVPADLHLVALLLELLDRFRESFGLVVVLFAVVPESVASLDFIANEWSCGSVVRVEAVQVHCRRFWVDSI